MASIQCAASVPRSGLFEFPPAFEVDPAPNPYYAVEIASEPRFFKRSNRHERSRANFFASWQIDAPLTSAQQYRPPVQAWNSLKVSNRIYFRAWTSADSRHWQRYQTTTSDRDASDAPFSRVFSVFHLPEESELVENYRARSEQVWRTAERLNEVAGLVTLDDVEVIIHLHPFTVGRFDPRRAEWVVIVKGTTTGEESAKVVVARLDFQTLSTVQVHSLSGAHRPIDSAQAAAMMRRNAPFGDMLSWLVNPDHLLRLGTFLVFDNFAGDFGAVQVVDPIAGRLIYSATTVWNGRGRHLLP